MVSRNMNITGTEIHTAQLAVFNRKGLVKKRPGQDKMGRRKKKKNMRKVSLKRRQAYDKPLDPDPLQGCHLPASPSENGWLHGVTSRGPIHYWCWFTLAIAGHSGHSD